MRIDVNGETREFPENLSVAGLLDAMALTGKRLAVEVNADIVPKSRHGETRLKSGDRVEIVHAIGGG